MTIQTVEQIEEIMNEATEAGFKKSEEFFQKELGGVDQYACGFAWLNIYKYNDKKIDGRSKIGKLMKAAGIEQDYDRIFMIWNPGGFGCQNVDTLEAGARAAAEVFQKNGFTAYAMSRLD